MSIYDLPIIHSLLAPSEAEDVQDNSKPAQEVATENQEESPAEPSVSETEIPPRYHNALSIKASMPIGYFFYPGQKGAAQFWGFNFGLSEMPLGRPHRPGFGAELFVLNNAVFEGSGMVDPETNTEPLHRRARLFFGGEPTLNYCPTIVRQGGVGPCFTIGPSFGGMRQRVFSGESILDNIDRETMYFVLGGSASVSLGVGIDRGYRWLPLVLHPLALNFRFLASPQDNGVRGALVSLELSAWFWAVVVPGNAP